MKKTLFLLVFLLCVQTGNSQPDIIDALKTPRASISNLSEIANDVVYIPLETTPGSIMGRIIDIKIRNNIIYAATVDNKIFCFDKSGRYLFNLNKPGKGPEEYLYCSEFDVNESNSILAVKGTKEIILYNQVPDGFTFLRRIRLNETPDRINFFGQNDNTFIPY